jgi:hypothetical protein
MLLSTPSVPNITNKFYNMGMHKSVILMSEANMDKNSYAVYAYCL